jgi:hypothetical protein
MSTNEPTNFVGVSWYSPATWKRLAAIPEACIRKSYREFVRACERMERALAAQGICTRRLVIDIDQMIAWCHRNGYEIDDRGRAIYGIVLTAAQDDPQALDMPIEDPTRSVQ